MKNTIERTERLIKDPYFSGYPTDFEAVLGDLNSDRERNNLRTEMEENDLDFNSDLWVKDYCRSIGVRFERVRNDELWYYITLDSFASLRKTDWDFDEISDERYISNYDELVNEVLEDDIENQAEDLMETINEQLWKFGGRCLGRNWNSYSLIELNGGLLKYCINTDFEIEISPIYEANESQIRILEEIKSEVE